MTHTLREFFANGGARAELKACSGPKPTYSQEMYALSFKMQKADMRHLLRKFARDASKPVPGAVPECSGATRGE